MSARQWRALQRYFCKAQKLHEALEGNIIRILCEDAPGEVVELTPYKDVTFLQYT